MRRIVKVRIARVTSRRARDAARAMSSSSDDDDGSDGGADLARRKRARRGRDEAIYGSFLDDFRGGDDDDATRRERGSARARERSGAPVAFRAASAGGGGGGGGLGFAASAGASGGGGGFGGFARGGTMTADDAMRGTDANGSDDQSDGAVSEEEEEEEEEEEDLLPSTFGQRCGTREDATIDATTRANAMKERLTSDDCYFRLVAGAAQRAKMAEEERKAKAAKRRAEEKAARARNKDNEDAFAGTSSRRDGGGRNSRANDDVGSFEKHTKGIGMKLLEKMGYKKGEGLGKGASGISRALETQLRPKNMGMGFNNFKENVNDPTRSSKREDDEGEASEDDMDVDDITRARDEAKRAREQSMWKKRNELRRQKREYKTAEELLAEEQENASSVQTTTNKLNIIDMRGAHATVVNANELHKARVVRAGEEDIMLPELQHNLKLVVDLAESDITKLDGKIRSEKDTQEILRREKIRLSKVAEAHDELAARTKSALALVEMCNTHGKACDTAEQFDALTQSWMEVVKQFPKEYYGHRLNRLALAHAAPYVRAMYKSWDLSKDPTLGVDILRPWRSLLSPELVPDEYKGVFEDDSYEDLLRDPMLSRLRPIISSKWDPTKPEDILNFVQAWSDVMPEALMREITHALVLPRLQRRVGEWEPTKERVALHVWFHPWLPMLHKNLKDLYPSIRQKFTVSLAEWEASDSSALTLLKPWQRVFEAKDWSSLMRRCVTPKLEDALAMLQINPSNQVLDPVRTVLKWESMLGPSAFITLLEQHFFRKWHAALHKWLTASNVDLDEVAQWYIGWKTVFSEELLSHERMRVQLNVALDMMNQAAAGEGVVMPNVAAPQPTAPLADERPVPHPMDESTMSLKEMIEEFANAHELEFIPSASGRRHDGLAVYVFGGVSVVVDTARESIRALIDGDWTPSSLDQLLDRARAIKR